MRITNNTLINNMMRHLNSGLGRLDHYQQQLSSGKRVLRPSHDPAGVISIMSLKTSLMENNQLLKNVDNADSWLASVDTILDSTTSMIHRVKELTIYASTDTLNENDRTAIQVELEELFNGLLEIANSTHGGKYIFAGQKSGTIPFQRDSLDPQDPAFFDISYHGGLSENQTAALLVEISPNSVIDINTITAATNQSGRAEDELFTPLFATISQIITDIKEGNIDNLSTSGLAELEASLDKTLSNRAEVGSKLNRVELAKERLLDLNINFNQLLSNEQNIDVAETIMNLKNEENVYRMALAVGARIIQPSLVDFLR